jgi:tRNA dimethylallyltransferase
MYTTTLFHGLANIPGRDQALREELGKLSDEDLHLRLVEVDPERASKLHLRDRLRAIRAIESFQLSGQKQSEVLEDHGFSEQCLKGLFIIPIWPRPELYKRIDERSHKMIARGLVEEVDSIVSKYGTDIQPLRSLGYAQVLEKRDEERDDEALAVEIALHTRRFAKRQMTFWRNEPTKRGWTVSPKQEGSAVRPTGRRAKLVEVGFCTLNLTKAEILDVVKKRLSEPMDVSEVWYVDARKLFY